MLPTLYRPGRFLWEPLMVLTELYASSHPLWPLTWNSWCSRDARISNDDSQPTAGAQAVIMCAQVRTTRPPRQWQRGCCTTPYIHIHIHFIFHIFSIYSIIFSPTNTLTCFTEEFTHRQSEICWSTILLKWHLLHNPIVVWFWYDIILHLVHVTPLTVPSKKYWPMIQLAVTPAPSSCVVGGLTSQVYNEDSV
jgi:hypothetical protein